jgi:hypothetical protein
MPANSSPSSSSESPEFHTQADHSNNAHNVDMLFRMLTVPRCDFAWGPSHTAHDMFDSCGKDIACIWKV